MRTMQIIDKTKFTHNFLRISELIRLITNWIMAYSRDVTFKQSQLNTLLSIHGPFKANLFSSQVPPSYLNVIILQQTLKL